MRINIQKENHDTSADSLEENLPITFTGGTKFLSPYLLKKKIYPLDVRLPKKVLCNLYNSVTKAPKLDVILTTTKS
jgi:hypothetical protein